MAKLIIQLILIFIIIINNNINCYYLNYPNSTSSPNYCSNELNEQYIECIGICPQYKHFKDKTCQNIKENEEIIKTTEFPLIKHLFCFSLRCWPGCRCNEGYVRENNENNAKCILPEECKFITTTSNVDTTTHNCEENENN